MHAAQVTNMAIGKIEHFLTSDKFGNDFYMLISEQRFAKLCFVLQNFENK